MHFWAVLPQKSPCWRGSGLSEASGTRLLFLKMNNRAVDRRCIYMRSPRPGKRDDLLTKVFPSPLGGANLWRCNTPWVKRIKSAISLHLHMSEWPSHLHYSSKGEIIGGDLLLFFTFPAWFSRSAELSQDVSFLLPGDEKMTTSFLRVIFHLIRFSFHSSPLCFRYQLTHLLPRLSFTVGSLSVGFPSETCSFNAPWPLTSPQLLLLLSPLTCVIITEFTPSQNPVRFE